MDTEARAVAVGRNCMLHPHPPARPGRAPTLISGLDLRCPSKIPSASSPGSQSAILLCAARRWFFAGLHVCTTFVLIVPPPSRGARQGLANEGPGDGFGSMNKNVGNDGLFLPLHSPHFSPLKACVAVQCELCSFRHRSVGRKEEETRVRCVYVVAQISKPFGRLNACAEYFPSGACALSVKR